MNATNHVLPPVCCAIRIDLPPTTYAYTAHSNILNMHIVSLSLVRFPLSAKVSHDQRPSRCRKVFVYKFEDLIYSFPPTNQCLACTTKLHTELGIFQSDFSWCGAQPLLDHRCLKSNKGQHMNKLSLVLELELN